MRIISNLINNSIQAIAINPKITLTALENNDFISLKIKDNGPGIPPEVLSKIGQDGNTKNKKFGSGIGLKQLHDFMQDLGNYKIQNLANGCEIELNFWKL